MRTIVRADEPGSEPMASGPMTFDNNDLPAFLAGFSPHAAMRHGDLAGPAAEGLPAPPAIDAEDAETLFALAEVLIAAGEHVPAVDDATRERLEGIIPAMPPHFRAALTAGLRGLDAAAIARRGRRFARLGVGARTKVIAAIERHGGKTWIQGLWMPIALAHFGRGDYLGSIGIEPQLPPAAEKPPRYMANVMPPEDLEAETDLPCDVVIIGSGAGGGPVAATLAERGLAVAVVEEGRYAGRREFSGDIEQRMFSLWRDRGMNLALSNGVVSVPTGATVGGTTTINSGTCLSPPDSLLREWRAAGFPEDFEPDRFIRWLDRAADEIGVTDADPKWIGRIGEIVARGAEALRVEGHDVEHGPLPRNAPDCDGQGTCQFGCPTDAKRSSNVSWIPRALRAGAHVFTGMRVRRILTRCGRAVGIEAHGQDRYGAPRRLRLRSRAVVVAGGTLMSPLLLRDNGVRLPRLGRGLSIHPAVGALAMFGEHLESPWKTIPQGYGIAGLVDERVRFEGSTSPPQWAAALLPQHGPELTRWMDAWNQVGHFGFMVRDRNVGSVVRGRGGHPLIRYRITPDVAALLQAGTATLAELLIRGGAEEVVCGVVGAPVLRSVDEARALTDRHIRIPQYRVIGFHPLGTCAMGADSDRGVVDFDHRVFGWRDLYVVDGSTVPTSLGVNPQLTIMAMALRAAEGIAEALH